MDAEAVGLEENFNESLEVTNRKLMMLPLAKNKLGSSRPVGLRHSSFPSQHLKRDLIY